MRRFPKPCLYGWGGGWLQEGSFPNSFSCGLSLHGWLNAGLLPPQALQRRQDLCVLPLLHRFSLSLWFHIASVSCRPHCCFCLQQEQRSGKSSQHWEPVCLKTVENEGGWGPWIRSPKIEVRGGERLAPAFPGPWSRVLQQTPQRLLWWGGETSTNGGEAFCACVCVCVSVRQTQLLHSSDLFPWMSSETASVGVRLPGCEREQMVQPLRSHKDRPTLVSAIPDKLRLLLCLQLPLSVLVC